MTPPSGQDLLQLISAELGTPPGEITLDRAIADIPSWDSMAWINIITAIESRTGKLFPVDRVDNIRNIGDLLTLAQE